MSDLKIGDWVVISGEPQQIIAINPPNDYDITISMIETEDDYVSIDSVTKWQPIPREWCIFHNKNQTKCARLAMFKCVAYSKCREGQYIDTQGHYWDYCEPFIGKLPSWLEETKCTQIR